MKSAGGLVRLVVLPPVGSQLELELDDTLLEGLVVEPWGGRSPRELTAAFERFSLGALPRGGLSD